MPPLLGQKKNNPILPVENLGGKFRFVFWIAIVLIVVLSVLGAVLIRNQTQIIKNEVAERGKLLGEFIATIVELPALHGDVVELERVVTDITKQNENVITYMVIFDRDGLPLTISSKKPEIINPSDVFVIQTPILEDFGWVEVGYSLIPLQNKRMALVVNIVAAIILSILMSGVGVIFTSRRLIIQPASRVSEMNKQLRELTEELDQKVKERTKELLQKVDELGESRREVLQTLNVVDDQRKKIEEEKNKTLAVINNFADGLLVFDKNEKLFLMNPQAESFFCLKDYEARSKGLSELKQIHSFRPIVELLGDKLSKIFRKELVLSQNLILEISAIPLIIEKGKEKSGYLVILHDITRDKFIERVKTEFVSLAAHQLRTPLTAIKWITRSFLIGDAGKITKKQKDLLEKSYKSNEKMVELVNDLLNVTKIEEGRLITKMEPHSLGGMFEKQISEMSELIKQRKINVILEKAGNSLPKVNIDFERINLVVQNLLDNAIKYNLDKGTVTISFKHDNMFLETMVKDTGIGITKPDQERLFSRFFRAENAIKRETEGSGLGLFLCKNIIEKHGGKIWLESEENKGTTIWFTLPIATDGDKNV